MFSYGKYVKSFFFFFFFLSSTHELSMLWLPPTLLVKLHIREFQMIREALFESSQGWPLVQSILEACIHIQVQYVEGTHQLCICLYMGIPCKGLAMLMWQETQAVLLHKWCSVYFILYQAYCTLGCPNFLMSWVSPFQNIVQMPGICLNLYLTQTRIHRTFITWSGTDRTRI